MTERLGEVDGKEGGKEEDEELRVVQPFRRRTVPRQLPKHISSAGIRALDGCMEGTRVSLLNDLQQWSRDVTAPSIFWLGGTTGTGKSAIARSFCRFFS
jgi:hypothetical protein